MVSNGRSISGAGCVSGAGMGNAHTGMRCQRIDEAGILPTAWISEKSFYYWLKKLRTQMVGAAAPQLVQLESLPAKDGILEIHYRGAEMKLPSGVDMDAVAALLRSIQSL